MRLTHNLLSTLFRSVKFSCNESISRTTYTYSQTRRLKNNRDNDSLENKSERARVDSVWAYRPECHGGGGEHFVQNIIIHHAYQGQR